MSVRSVGRTQFLRVYACHVVWPPATDSKKIAFRRRKMLGIGNIDNQHTDQVHRCLAISVNNLWLSVIASACDIYFLFAVAFWGPTANVSNSIESWWPEKCDWGRTQIHLYSFLQEARTWMMNNFKRICSNLSEQLQRHQWLFRLHL